MLGICVCPVDISFIGGLLHFLIQSTLFFVVRQVKGVLNHIVAKLVLKQISQGDLIWLERGWADRNFDQALEYRLLICWWCAFQAIFNYV